MEEILEVSLCSVGETVNAYGGCGNPFSFFQRRGHLLLSFYLHSLVSKKRCTLKDTPNLVNSVLGRRQEKQSFLRDKELFHSQGGNSFLLPSREEAMY